MKGGSPRVSKGANGLNKMEYEFDYNDFPLAYLVTLRSYGTWLHGTEELSVDRHGFNAYGSPKRQSDAKLKGVMQSEMKQKSFLFDKNQRPAIEKAVTEVCEHRNYG